MQRVIGKQPIFFMIATGAPARGPGAGVGGRDLPPWGKGICPPLMGYTGMEQAGICQSNPFPVYRGGGRDSIDHRISVQWFLGGL